MSQRKQTEHDSVVKLTNKSYTTLVQRSSWWTNEDTTCDNLGAGNVWALLSWVHRNEQIEKDLLSAGFADAGSRHNSLCSGHNSTVTLRAIWPMVSNRLFLTAVERFRSLASRPRSFSPFSSEKTFNAAFSTDRCEDSDSLLLRAEAAAFLHRQLVFFLVTPHIRFNPRRT